MTTTANQDPGDRFTSFIEEVRRIGEVQGRRPGIAGRMHLLICELFIFILRLLANRAAEVRNGATADTAASGGEERQIGWQRRWTPEAAVSGGEACSPLPRAGMVEVSVAAPQADAEAVVLDAGVEAAAELRLPRPACVRIAKDSCEHVSTRAPHVDDGVWLRWRGPGLDSAGESGFLGFHLRKRVFGLGFRLVVIVPG